MNKYIIITILQLACLIAGLILAKISAKLRKCKMISKRIALINYIITLLLFLAGPTAANRIVMFIFNLI